MNWFERFRRRTRTSCGIGGVEAHSRRLAARQDRVLYVSRYLTDGPNGEKIIGGGAGDYSRGSEQGGRFAYEHGAQVLAHCNGDAAVDMMLEAHRAAGAPAGRRTTIIHSQFARPRPARKVRRLWFRRVLLHQPRLLLGRRSREEPRQRARLLLEPDEDGSRLGNADVESQRFLCDAARPALHRMDGGKPPVTIRPRHRTDERVTPHDAFKALTIDAAYQYGEETPRVRSWPGSSPIWLYSTAIRSRSIRWRSKTSASGALQGRPNQFTRPPVRRHEPCTESLSSHRSSI